MSFANLTHQMSYVTLKECMKKNILAKGIKSLSDCEGFQVCFKDVLVNVKFDHCEITTDFLLYASEFKE